MKLSIPALLATTVCILTSGAAYASNTGPGIIRDMSAWKSGLMEFNQMGARTPPPACQRAGDPQSWVIDTTTAAGQAQAAVMLTAYSARKQVVIIGNDACDVTSDKESVLYVEFVDPY